MISWIVSGLVVLWASRFAVVVGECVSTCQNMANGDYQSCNGCNVYVTCSNGLTYDNRPCPAGLVWDDNVKRCEYTSATCSVTWTTDLTGCIRYNNNGPRQTHPTLAGCQQACEDATDFVCCSVDYIASNGRCYLSDDNRYSVPAPAYEDPCRNPPAPPGEGFILYEITDGRTCPGGVTRK